MLRVPDMFNFGDFQMFYARALTDVCAAQIMWHSLKCLVL